MQPILVFRSYTETLSQICELLTSSQMLPDDCTVCAFPPVSEELHTVFVFACFAVCLVFKHFIAFLFLTAQRWIRSLVILNSTQCLNRTLSHVLSSSGFPAH